MHMDDIKTFANNENELEIILQCLRINSQKYKNGIGD